MESPKKLLPKVRRLYCTTILEGREGLPEQGIMASCVPRSSRMVKAIVSCFKDEKTEALKKMEPG